MEIIPLKTSRLRLRLSLRLWFIYWAWAWAWAWAWLGGNKEEFSWRRRGVGGAVVCEEMHCTERNTDEKKKKKKKKGRDKERVVASSRYGCAL